MWSHVDSDTETWPMSRDLRVKYLLSSRALFQSLGKLFLLLEQAGAGGGSDSVLS